MGQMTQDEVKAVEVGQKIKVNGTETVVTAIYERNPKNNWNEADYGFDTEVGVVTNDMVGNSKAFSIVCNSAVTDYFDENVFEKEVN